MILAPLLSCARDGDTIVESGPTIGTGWFTETATPDTAETAETESESGPICEHLVSETEPKTGTDDWYWRAAPIVRTVTTDASAYQARLLTEEGFEVPTTPVWSETATEMRLELDEALEPSTAYRLEITDCSGTFEIPFLTSAYGLPLEDGPNALVGLVYSVDLTLATWVEPEAFGALVALYFTDPVLVEVEWADTQVLDLLGAPGFVNAQGDVVQNFTNTTWDFPPADFQEQPLFAASGAVVAIPVDVGIYATIYDFALGGTFSADGRTFAGGTLDGRIDTRELGQLLGDNDPWAMCEFVEDLGIECIECPDGEPYCVQAKAEEVSGVVVDGLSLLPI